VYYTGEAENKKYLTPDEGRKITQRTVGYSGLNIIMEENAWAGISVTRNKVLVPDVATNNAFIYTTPTIRFISVLTPLLDPAIEINLADYTDTGGQQTLQLYIANFLKALFSEIINEDTVRQIKVDSRYNYSLQEADTSLRAEIPIGLTTPYNIKIPADLDISTCPLSPADITPSSAFVCQITAMIQQWFTTNQPVTTDAKFTFDISLFAALSDTQLPVLRLRNIYIKENNIKWS